MFIVFRTLNYNQINSIWQIITKSNSKIATSTINRFIKEGLIKKRTNGGTRKSTYHCGIKEGNFFEDVLSKFPEEVRREIFAMHNSTQKHDVFLRDFMINQIPTFPQNTRLFFPGRWGDNGVIIPDAVVIHQKILDYIEYDNLSEPVSDFLVKVVKYIALIERSNVESFNVVFVFRDSKATDSRVKNFARKTATLLQTLDGVKVSEWLSLHPKVHFYFWSEDQVRKLYPLIHSENSSLTKEQVSNKEMFFV